jgi:predicted nucleic acid-binding protein
VVAVGPDDRDLLAEAIALGNEDKRTLGFLPHQGYAQACANGTLIAALEDGHVIAYALYALPRQIVRLTHLCVSGKARSRGLARLLVDIISERHADRFGIALKCRNDFPANEMWPSLGFQRQGEVRGRSRRRLPLTVWWRDHGHPTLFTATAESLGVLRIMLDLNVFIDLESTYKRPEYEESSALTSDWLADQIDLAVSSELFVEIGRHPNENEKEWQLRAAERYHAVSPDTGPLVATARRITDLILKSSGIDLSSDVGDISDVRHLAAASLAGITVIATRDERFIDWSAHVLEITGVRVLRPADVVVQLDELARAQEYRPVQLEDTEYALTPVRSRSDAELLKFMNDSKSERKSNYLSMIHRLLSEGPRWNRMILRDPHGEPIAFFILGTDESQLIVPILRVRAQRLEETVTRQLLFHLRKQARAADRSVIRISDPALSDTMIRAVREEGFVYHQNNWIGFAIQSTGDAAKVDADLSDAAALAGLQLPVLRTDLSAAIAADLERTLWPIKITDSKLPTFLVPIRPEWSAELFGVPQILMPRSNMLGISREHVYYRSPQPRILNAPARLLWYASGAGKHGGVAAVIACSRLEEVIAARPADLHQRFRHLGVWQLQQIASVARDGVSQALRFADTEVFPHRVSLRRLQELAHQKRQPLSLQSPKKISSQLFTAVYQEGLSGHG